MAYVHNKKNFPVAVVKHIIKPHDTVYIDIPKGMVSNKNISISYCGIEEPVEVKVVEKDTRTTAQRRGRKSKQINKESE